MSGMEGGKTCRSLRVIHLHVQDGKAEKVVVVPTETASRLIVVVQLDDGVSLMLELPRRKWRDNKHTAKMKGAVAYIQKPSWL